MMDINEVESPEWGRSQDFPITGELLTNAVVGANHTLDNPSPQPWEGGGRFNQNGGSTSSHQPRYNTVKSPFTASH